MPLQGFPRGGHRLPGPRARAGAPGGAAAPSQAPGARGQSGSGVEGLRAQPGGRRSARRPGPRQRRGRLPEEPRVGERSAGGPAEGRHARSRHAPLGSISNPRHHPLPPRPAGPATGGGPRVIGRAPRRRALIGCGASRPRCCVRRRLHFVGRGRRRRSVRDGEVASS